MFTGLFDGKKPGEYPYLILDGESEDGLRRGRPPAGRIRHEISFEGLPEDVRGKILETYRDMWGLEE